VTAKARIDVRIRRLSLGLAGDWRSVGHGVRELRVDHGPGYRIYFTTVEGRVIILLAGGDKSSQRDDIRRAIELAEGLEE
jgi:putative addiction module killer protein